MVYAKTEDTKSSQNSWERVNLAPKNRLYSKISNFELGQLE